jgi:hypothetical protein
MARVKRTRQKTKTCAMTYMEFPVTEFYANLNTLDNLHPYSKKADNFRRRLKGTNIGTRELRTMFKNLLTLKT